MKIEIPALDEKTQDRIRARETTFYGQSVSENNQRLTQNATDFAALLAEIKFIESVLLTGGPQ
jgi:hypothetical protein